MGVTFIINVGTCCIIRTQQLADLGMFYESEVKLES